jgi:hypothetical protein
VLGGTAPTLIPVQISNNPELFVNDELLRKFGYDPVTVHSWYSATTAKQP